MKKTLLLSLFVLFGVSIALAQIKVTGVVTDDATGEALPFVTVALKGTTTTTSTTDNGSFSITVPSSGSILQFTFLGYENLEIPVTTERELVVKMKVSTTTIEEVVVTGYQTIAKERSSGSFAIVNSEKLENKLQPSIKSVLEGQAAGVVLTKDQKIEIRGISTFDANNAPLIVLDGYPLIGNKLDIDFINPDNIESITVLKDAVAASIYGSQSSNGVIVINTKSGSAAGGINRLNVNYKGAYGMILKPDLSKLNIASVEDYMDAELTLYNLDPNSSYNSYNNYSKISDYTYLLMAKDRGLMPVAEADAKIAALKNNNALQQIQDKLMQMQQSHQHNLSLTSTTALNQFGATLRYVNEKGSIITDKKSRLNFDINNTWKPKKWLSLRLFSNLNYTTAHTPVDAYTVNAGNLSIDPNTPTWRQLTAFTATDKILPYTQLYDANDNPVYWEPIGQRKKGAYETTPGMKSVLYHPTEDLTKTYTTNSNLQIRIGGDLNIKFFDFLQGSIGGTWTKGSLTARGIYEGDSYIMRAAYNDGTSRSNNTKHYIPEGGRIDEIRGTIDTWVIRGQMNYNQSFNSHLHRISAIAGMEIIQDTYENSFLPTRLGYDPVSATYNSGFNMFDYNNNAVNLLAGINIPGDFLHGIKSAAANGVNFANPSYGGNYALRDKRMVGWYGNGSYEYNNKYVINGSIRWELSNFYGTDPKYRYKPTWSVGATYKMAEEAYFSELRPIFDRFNIRATYGELGSNSLNYTPYLILSVGTYNNTTGGVSYAFSSFPNNQLRYEKKRTFDVGLDLSLLKNRIDISIDYYHNKSYDLIANEVVDETRGVTSLPQNVGEITNKGIEATINARIIRDKAISWNSDLIVSYNTTHVDHYNISRLYFTSYGRAAPLMVEGYPADGFWGARFSRIDDQGTALFYSKDGQEVEGGSLTAEDAVYLGTQRPPLDINWTNSFRYKNWEASFMFIAKFGAKYRKDAFVGSNFINRHVGERWREPGDESKTIYPKLTSWNMDMFYYPYSDILVGKANYIKLRDFTLSYNLPAKWINAIGLTGVKAYFQTRNLFYITAKGVDIDPEISEFNATGGTGAMTNQGFTSLQLRPEFYFGLMINL